MNCYRCGNLITEVNQSEEHVINNALGGHLTSQELVCNGCNKIFGYSVDADIEKQIGMFADLLGVKRHRENKDRKIRVNLVSEDGGRKVVGHKMQPLHELHLDTGEKKVVLFEDEERYRSLKNRKKLELAKKFKVEDAEYVKQPDKTKYHIQNSLSDGLGNIAFGGPEFFRGAAKMCLNYYLSQGYDRTYCQNVIDFVNGVKKINDLAYFYYPTHYAIHEQQEEEVIHLIHIQGNTQYKLLYAYIELFSAHNAVIIFSLNYQGPAISDTYAYDLIGGQLIDKPVKMRLPRHHLEIIDLIERDVHTEHLRKFNRLERIIEKRQLL